MPHFSPVSVRRGRVDSLTASSFGDVIAVRTSTAYQPKNVQAGPPGGQLSRLSDTRPELRRVRWGTQERLSYTASDGLALDGLLILPAGLSRKDGTGEWTDILTGIDLLIAEGVADPERLGIGGWSHGGFMAAWAVGQTHRFKAALMGAGISDWGMQAGVGELGTQETGLGGSSGWEGAGPHRHDQLSPVCYASKVATPALILHGQDDTNVPAGQATYFHRALSQFGVEHELVIYPREGHSIVERNHQIDLLRRTREWFGRWLG